MKNVFLPLAFFLLASAALAESPLCSDMTRYACAPGRHADPTGVVKSSSEIEDLTADYARKSKRALSEKFSALVKSNSYFRELAISGLGLKNSPQCLSTKPADVKDCQDNLIDGLTMLAQKQTLSMMLPADTARRMGTANEVDFILKDQNYADIISDFNKQALRDLTDTSVDKKVEEKIFPGVKKAIIDRLNQLDIPEAQKKFMISKVSAIKYMGSDCSDQGSSSPGPAPQATVNSLLFPNAYYVPEKNTFKFCSGYSLQSSSEFQIAAAIAHELSHSIDPCSLAKGPADMGFKYTPTVNPAELDAQYPIKNVISCLRDPRSMYAHKVDPNAAPGAAQPYGGSINGAFASQSYASFCENDQIGESFADWMGDEVLPAYIEKNYRLTPEEYQEGYANTFRLMCQLTRNVPIEKQVNDVHPTTEIRISGVLMANPRVRAQMGCGKITGTYPVYCDPDKPLPPLNGAIGSGNNPGAAPVQSSPEAIPKTIDQPNTGGGVQ